MPEFVLRDAQSDDLEAVAGIHVAGWQSAYRGIIADERLDRLTVEQRLGLWQEWWQGDRVLLRVAVSAGAVVGFLRRSPARDFANAPADAAEISHLYLDPTQVGSGVGAALFEEALASARAEGFSGLVLWVLERNLRARRFYERFGLEPDGARHDEPAWLGEGVFEVRYAIRFD